MKIKTILALLSVGVSWGTSPVLAECAGAANEHECFNNVPGPEDGDHRACRDNGWDQCTCVWNPRAPDLTKRCHEQCMRVQGNELPEYGPLPKEDK